MTISSKKILLFIFSGILFVGFQNFSNIDSDPIEKFSQKKNPSKEDLIENQVDLKLSALQQKAHDPHLAEKCFETRVTCFANRNHEKCLVDKISQYLKCSKINSSYRQTESARSSF